MAANASIIYNYDNINSELPEIQDLKSLTLHWRSFSGWGSECDAILFAYKGGQYFDYVLPQPYQFFITCCIGPKIVDALLTLIFRMG